MTHELRETLRQTMARAMEALGAAQQLLSTGYCQDSVSRSYYAVVHAASAALVARGIEVRSHRALVSLFGLHFIRPGFIEREFGEALMRLQRDRDLSDYDVSIRFDATEAGERLNQAERFVQRIRSLLADEGLLPIDIGPPPA